jgi:aminodeoxyfutalosine deaminase
MNIKLTHIAAHYVFNGHRFLKDAYISLDDSGKVFFVSEENQALNERERMIFYNGIIAPAFINAHCHLELSGLKNKTDIGKGLTKFINSVAKLNHEQEQNEEIIKQYDRKMYLNGIQAVGDIMNGGKSLQVKSNSKIRYHNFIEVFGIDETLDDKKMNQALVFKELSQKYGINFSITPHSFYSLSNGLMNRVLGQDSEILSIHFLESQEELDYLCSLTGEMYESFSNSFKYLPDFIKSESDLSGFVRELLAKQVNLILVHNLVLERDFLTPKKNLFLCLCPASNLLISNRLPSKDLLEDSDHNFVIGTDSLASNTKLCILNEMVLLEEYLNIPLEKMLKWATFNGAKALNLDGLGEIASGNTPGIILIDNIDIRNLKLTKTAIVKRIY